MACPARAAARRAWHAWGLILASWLVRVFALVLLLGTLGLGFSVPLAVMFVCAGAASAAIPFGLAGAATQVGAGATLLAISGIDGSRALGFALAAQALVVLAGAAVFLFAIAWLMALRLRPARELGAAGVAGWPLTPESLSVGEMRGKNRP
jgi:hypothetical protein